ncbi:MAG: GDP-mannose 4,6-dehydratase [Candidatus Levybacteria bacterium]|nr:GDP-mannose 4,6-dehydratase [Candidatus Levybacteria bacterium]
MKVLITGIKGFIGQHLSRKLIERGHKVKGLENKNGGVLNKILVERAIRDADVVVHLAALTSHKELVDNRLEALEISFLGTKNALDAFVKSKTAKKFLFASTGKVYGKIVRLPIDEDHPTSPLNILGKSKLIAEKLIDFYASTLDSTSSPQALSIDQKEFVIFRAFQVYGLEQKRNFLIPTIISQINSGKKEIILGDIKAKRDYVYIDDLIDAFIKVVERKTTKGLSIYNICTGVGSSAGDIVRLIGKIKAKKIKIKVDTDLLREDEMHEEYGSYKKAKKELGWEPKIVLEEGLEMLFKKNEK